MKYPLGDSELSEVSDYTGSPCSICSEIHDKQGFTQEEVDARALDEALMQTLTATTRVGPETEGAPLKPERRHYMAAGAGRQGHSTYLTEHFPPAKPQDDQPVLHSFRQGGRLICKFVSHPPVEQRSTIFEPIRKDGRLLLREKHSLPQRPTQPGETHARFPSVESSHGCTTTLRLVPALQTLPFLRPPAVPVYVPEANALSRSLSAAGRIQSFVQLSNVAEEISHPEGPHQKLVRSASTSSTPQQVESPRRLDVCKQTRFSWAPTQEMQCSLQIDMEHLAASSPKPSFHRSASMPDISTFMPGMPCTTGDCDALVQHSESVEGGSHSIHSQDKGGNQEVGGTRTKGVAIVPPDATGYDQLHNSFMAHVSVSDPHFVGCVSMALPSTPSVRKTALQNSKGVRMELDQKSTAQGLQAQAMDADLRKGKDAEMRLHVKDTLTPLEVSGMTVSNQSFGSCSVCNPGVTSAASASETCLLWETRPDSWPTFSHPKGDCSDEASKLMKPGKSSKEEEICACVNPVKECCHLRLCKLDLQQPLWLHV